jgi:hypothetical protein
MLINFVTHVAIDRRKEKRLQIPPLIFMIFRDKISVQWTTVEVWIIGSSVYLLRFSCGPTLFSLHRPFPGQDVSQAQTRQ